MSLHFPHRGLSVWLISLSLCFLLFHHQTVDTAFSCMCGCCFNPLPNGHCSVLPQFVGTADQGTAHCVSNPSVDDPYCVAQCESMFPQNCDGPSVIANCQPEQQAQPIAQSVQLTSKSIKENNESDEVKSLDSTSQKRLKSLQLIAEVAKSGVLNQVENHPAAAASLNWNSGSSSHAICDCMCGATDGFQWLQFVYPDYSDVDPLGRPKCTRPCQSFLLQCNPVGYGIGLLQAPLIGTSVCQSKDAFWSPVVANSGCVKGAQRYFLGVQCNGANFVVSDTTIITDQTCYGITVAVLPSIALNPPLPNAAPHQGSRPQYFYWLVAELLNGVRIYESQPTPLNFDFTVAFYVPPLNQCGTIVLKLAVAVQDGNSDPYWFQSQLIIPNIQC